jgi:hypothetical protein
LFDEVQKTSVEMILDAAGHGPALLQDCIQLSDSLI